MAFFEDKDIQIRTRVIKETGDLAILQISFEGIHDHYWPAGKRIRAFIEKGARDAKPAGCLFDFLGYDYSFGNEICDPIMTVLMYGGPPCPPIAIVAEGRTSRSLKSLFAVTSLDKITDIDFFEDIENGLAFLRWALEKRKKPSLPSDR